MESHESEVPRPLFASTPSQRDWHQRDPLLRLGIPNLAELRRFLPRQVDIAEQSKMENLPGLAMLSLPLRTLQNSCPNIVPVVMKLVGVSLSDKSRHVNLKASIWYLCEVASSKKKTARLVATGATFQI